MKNNLVLYGQFHRCRMSSVLRSVEAADCGKTCGVVTFAIDESCLLEHVGAFGQAVEEVVGVGIAHGTVVAKATLIAIA